MASQQTFERPSTVAVVGFRVRLLRSGGQVETVCRVEETRRRRDFWRKIIVRSSIGRELYLDRRDIS